YFALRSDLSFEVLCEPSLMKVYVIKRRNKDYQIVLMICLNEFQNIVMLVLTILTCSVAEVTQFLPWYVSLTVGFSCTKKSLIIMIESSAHGDEYDGVMYSQLVSSVLCIVQLICTVTPASGSMEETHNTLKFASRAKQVEIHASRNRVNILFSIWLEMLKEISSLKQELEHFKKGMLSGASQDEIMSLRQQVNIEYVLQMP
ncbi:hypothetical protein GW17_00040777, partial [Ensete ventricosum]